MIKHGAVGGNGADTRRKVAWVFARAGGVVALTFLLAACGSNGAPAPTPTVSASETATPAPSPSETATPVAANPFGGELATTPDKISEYASPNFGLDQFKALSPSERTALFISMAKDPVNGLAAYAQMYTYVSGNSADALPAKISADNTPQEIMTIATYGQRFALSFDQATAEKMLPGAMTDPTSSSYIDMENTLKKIAPISARVLGAYAKDGNGILTGTFVSASEKKVDARGTTYIDIVVQGKVNKVTATCYYVTNGSIGMWEWSGSKVAQ